MALSSGATSTTALAGIAAELPQILERQGAFGLAGQQNEMRSTGRVLQLREHLRIFHEERLRVRHRDGAF